MQKNQPNPYLLIFLSVAFTAVVTASTGFLKSSSTTEKKVIVIEEKVKECAERQAVINIYTDRKLEQLQKSIDDMRKEQKEDMIRLQNMLNKKINP